MRVNCGVVRLLRSELLRKAAMVMLGMAMAAAVAWAGEPGPGTAGEPAPGPSGEPAARPPAGRAAAKGEAEYRQAWLAFVAPAADEKQSQSLEARQQARMAAIPLMEAAAAANPDNFAYHESLAYICLSAGQYEKAKAAAERAIRLKPKGPGLYLLRGQAEAALAQMDPPHVGERIGPALADFDRAAQLDPPNPLALLQGASVALDAGREDLALARVKKALARGNCFLYALGVPLDLNPERGASVRSWQYVELGHWFEVLARCRNVHRALVKLGAKAEQSGDLAAADQHFRWALQVGRQVGEMQPNMFITVATGIDLMEDSYTNLARIAETKKSKQAERWKGEAGVAGFARSQLRVALEAYVKEITKNPAPTVAGLLETEGRYLEPIVAGIGLTPQGRQAKPQDKGKAPSGEKPGKAALRLSPQRCAPAGAG